MRILIWSSRPLEEESAFWFWLKQGQEHLGHQVIAVDALALVQVYGIGTMQQILLHYAHAFRVNAALVLPGNIVEPWFLQALRANGIATVGLRVDDGIHCSPGMPLPEAALWRRLTWLDEHCDLVTTICQRAVDVSTRYGRPPLHYLPAAYPWELVTPASTNPEPVIRYCGSPRYRPDQPPSFRVQVAKALVESGLPVTFHHDAWAAVPGFAAVARPTPSSSEMFELIRSATVNLCLPSEYAPEPYPMFKGLNNEIAAAGALQITYPCQELQDMFGDDVLVTAESPADFVSQARFWLDRPAEALARGRRSREILAATYGWGPWWGHVADLLAAKGMPLDLTAPPVQPDPAVLPVLSMAAISMAHLFEGQGRTALARHYFAETLSYDPGDYAALAGIGRLTLDPDERRQWWRQAAETVSVTHPLPDLTHLPTAVLARSGTFFAMEAAVEWISAALAAGKPDDVTAAVRYAARLQAEPGLHAAKVLLEQGHLVQARACLNAVSFEWPNHPEIASLQAALTAATRPA